MERAPYGPFVTALASFEISTTFQEHQERSVPIGGIDMYGETRNDPVIATRSGSVTYFDDGDDGYGFHAIIDYQKDGMSFREIFAHLDRPPESDDLLEQGSFSVSKGDVLGTIGNTGNCWTTANDMHDMAPVTDAERAEGWGTHLHWEQQKLEGNKWETINPWELENAL